MATNNSWPPTPDHSKMMAEKDCWGKLLRKIAAGKGRCSKCCSPILFLAEGGLGGPQQDTTLPSFVAKREFWTSRKQPSRCFVLLGRPKLWRNTSVQLRRAALSSFRARQTSKTVVKSRFSYAADVTDSIHASETTHWFCCILTWKGRRFKEPTFRPSWPTNHSDKRQCFCMFLDFPNISRTCIFFFLALSLSLFYFSCLCFSSLHIVRSLTSKLPSSTLWYAVILCSMVVVVAISWQAPRLSTCHHITWHASTCHYFTSLHLTTPHHTPSRDILYHHHGNTTSYPVEGWCIWASH